MSKIYLGPALTNSFYNFYLNNLKCGLDTPKNFDMKNDQKLSFSIESVAME